MGPGPAFRTQVNIPVSLLVGKSVPCIKPLLIRNPGYCKSDQKTLEWSTIIAEMPEMTVLIIPGYSCSPGYSCLPGVISALSGPFNQDQAARRRG